MGGSTSRVIIDAETSSRMLGHHDLSRFKAGFSRLCQGRPVQTGRLNRRSFREGFLGTSIPNMPALLQDAIFQAFDTTDDQTVAWEEFVSGLCVLKCGTREQRLRMLFFIYDTERDNKLSKAELSPFLRESCLGTEKDARGKTDTESLIATFAAAKGDALTPEEFMHWANQRDSAPIVKWIFEIESTIMGMPAPASSAKPLSRQSLSKDLLAQATNLSEDTVGDLCEVFDRLKKNSDARVLDLPAMERAFSTRTMGRGLPLQLISKLFSSLDRTGSKTLNLDEFVTGMAVCCERSSSFDEKLSFAFKVFDSRQSGELSRNEFGEMLECVWSADETRQGHTVEPQTAAEEMGALVEAVFADVDPKGISEEQYCEWAREHPMSLAFIDTMWEIMCIELGLQPRNPEHEAATITRVSPTFDSETVTAAAGTELVLISAKWWVAWEIYTRGQQQGVVTSPVTPGRPRTLSRNGSKPQPPPKIDNSHLLQSGCKLRINLTEGVDYKVISQPAWNALYWWYGGGPEIRRQVIQCRGGKAELELYPLHVSVFQLSSKGKVLGRGSQMSVSKITEFSELLSQACELLRLSEQLETNTVQMWSRTALDDDEDGSWQLLSLDDDENASVQELGLIDGHQLLLEVQQLSGAWPSDTWGSTSPRVPTTPTSKRSEKKLSAGVVGLQNLGNTCYMNSALQCLSHTQLLRDYFLQGDYQYDVNVSSKFGMAGHLAVSFSDLINDLWTMRGKVLAPRYFKDTIGRFNAMFEGQQQQDAQEMLSIVMTGLAEDLNRIKVKPYVEYPDSKGRPDTLVAAEWWALGMRREFSAMALLFAGQFKSNLRCTACQFESARFDVFSSLQVELPSPSSTFLDVIIVFADRSQVPMQAAAEVPRDGTLWHLFAAIHNLKIPTHAVLGDDSPFLEGDELVAADVTRNSVWAILDLDTLVSQLGSMGSNLYVYQVAKIPKGEDSTCQLQPGAVDQPPADPELPTAAEDAEDALETVIFTAVHRKQKMLQRYWLEPCYPVLFAIPSILRVKPSELTANALYLLVWKQCIHMVPEYDPVDVDQPWPFQLVRVNRSGTAWGNWLDGCSGLPIPANDEHLEGFDAEVETIAVDWDMTVHNEFYNDRTTGKFEVHISIDLRKEKELMPIQLQECMKTFTASETVTAFCGDCTKANNGEFTETEQEKKLAPWAVPPVLVITLKRFKTTAHSRQKLTNLVQFPINELDLSDFIAEANIPPDSPTLRAAHHKVTRMPSGVDGSNEEDAVPCYLSRDNVIYDLYGVVNHQGVLGGGHYYAFVKSNGMWLCFNDDQVTVTSEASVVSQNAYILFYQRRDMNNFVGKIMPPVSSPKVDVQKVKNTKWERPEVPKGSPNEVEKNGICMVM